MVEYVDGSVLAQMSPNDMRFPILYALTYPERVPTPLKGLDLTGLGTLEFLALDPTRYPAVGLATAALERMRAHPRERLAPVLAQRATHAQVARHHPAGRPPRRQEGLVPLHRRLAVELEDPARPPASLRRPRARERHVVHGAVARGCKGDLVGAQGIAGLPLFSGFEYRIMVWIVIAVVTVIYVSRYAKRVKLSPASSPVYAIDQQRTAVQTDFSPARLSRQHGLVLLGSAIAFGFLIIGAMQWNWGINELSGLFLALAILSGPLGGLSLNATAEKFIDGAASLTVTLDNGTKVTGRVLGLDTVLASGGGLSAGEAQLLAFTRVFLRNPGLVILDEASSRLDPATEQHLERAIDKLLLNRTAIIIAHRLGTVQRADEIMILEGGTVSEYGDRKQLVADTNSRFYQLLQTGLEVELTDHLGYEPHAVEGRGQCALRQKGVHLFLDDAGGKASE